VLVKRAAAKAYERALGRSKNSDAVN
jgi:hypothetical protein